jgi:hypothetical protein
MNYYSSLGNEICISHQFAVMMSVFLHKDLMQRDAFGAETGAVNSCIFKQKDWQSS